VVRDLHKTFGDVAALRGVDFELRPGEVLGLLGPNGAGKTTTVESILGLIAPDRGGVSVCGIEVERQPRLARRRIGVVLQDTGLPDAITPHEAIAAFSALYGEHADSDGLLARYGLAEKAHARAATLSGGQKQRLALALAFLGDPDVVILDEPTVGLDPVARRELIRHVEEMKAEGRAVLLATHDMEEAAELCDRIVVIDRGRVVAEGTTGELVSAVSLATRMEFTVDRPVELAGLRAHPNVTDLVANGLTIRFATDDIAAVLPGVAQTARAQAAAIVALQASRGSLEDVILQLAGRTQ
jgi:ABC-2 type transport system ATP-binding protein